MAEGTTDIAACIEEALAAPELHHVAESLQTARRLFEVGNFVYCRDLVGYLLSQHEDVDDKALLRRIYVGLQELVGDGSRPFAELSESRPSPTPRPPNTLKGARASHRVGKRRPKKQGTSGGQFGGAARGAMVDPVIEPPAAIGMTQRAMTAPAPSRTPRTPAVAEAQPGRVAFAFIAGLLLGMLAMVVVVDRQQNEPKPGRQGRAWPPPTQRAERFSTPARRAPTATTRRAIDMARVPVLRDRAAPPAPRPLPNAGMTTTLGLDPGAGIAPRTIGQSPSRVPELQPTPQRAATSARPGNPRLTTRPQAKAPGRAPIQPIDWALSPPPEPSVQPLPPPPAKRAKKKPRKARAPAKKANKGGWLQVSSTPPTQGKVTVLVAGKPRGRVPLKIPLGAGLHEVQTVDGEGRIQLRMVRIEAGGTKQLRISIPAEAP